MVVGPKISLQSVPSRGRISLAKIQNFTVEKRQPFTRIVYGTLIAIIGVVIAIVNPIKIVTNYYLQMKEGSFLFTMWEKPTYQLYSEVWVYNYTNVPEYLNGDTKVLKLEEVGPFRFQELRTNDNMKIDHDAGVMTFDPNTTLQFLREESVADTNDVNIYVPNVALIAISTIAADKLGYLPNVGLYYSISAMGTKLFRNLTVEQYFWGYDDELVTVANKILPGWIDFSKIGLMDRFYAVESSDVEVELRNESKRYTINKWDGSPGLATQGYTALDSSTPCNRIEGSYEGFMTAPNLSKDKPIRFFRKQACRVYPFAFEEEIRGAYGFNYYKFALTRDSFNKSSEFSCKCNENCLPDGFVDVGGCFYGFPVALSKPHFLDVDPVQASYFEGMHPDREKHNSWINIEPTLGVPISLSSKIQVNIAVRMSAGNTLTKPLKDKILPLLWLSMYCKEPPPEVISIMRLRFVIAPPLVITLEVLLLIIGIILGVQGGYRIWKPKYKLIEKKPSELKNRRKVSFPIVISDNKGFSDDEDLAKEAVSLLAIKEEDNDIPDLLIET